MRARSFPNRAIITYGLIACFWSLTALGGCGTAKSVVPGLDNEKPESDRLHLQVTPEEAVVILREVAPQHGWQVVSTGDQFDMTGPRGKYFRLEADRFIGGKKSINGVFFNEPTGAYVMIDNKVGLPESLIEPLTAAVEARTKVSSEP